LEIYNEEIRDLLSKNPKNKLELHEKPDTGVYVKDLSFFAVKCVSEINDVMKIGMKNRSTGSTKMNAVSSRSHSLFQITIERSEIGADGK
jgi:kinesin family protein 3/17